MSDAAPTTRPDRTPDGHRRRYHTRLEAHLRARLVDQRRGDRRPPHRARQGSRRRGPGDRRRARSGARGVPDPHRETRGTRLCGFPLDRARAGNGGGAGDCGPVFDARGFWTDERRLCKRMPPHRMPVSTCVRHRPCARQCRCISIGTAPASTARRWYSSCDFQFGVQSKIGPRVRVRLISKNPS
jgi:hypothetical protein